jgi:D-3-phosphoglycerate dehydrogenase
MTSATRSGPIVVIHRPIQGQDWSYEIERQMLEARGVHLVVAEDAAHARAVLPDADVLFACDVVTADEINLMRHPVGILSYGVGIDQIDANAAAARGIPIRNCPTHNSEEVSDHAVLLLLAGNKRLLDFANAAAEGNWGVHGWPQMRGQIHRMRGHTVGMIGIGRIGQKIARKVHGFGLKVIAYDPFVRVLPDPWADLASLDDVLTRSDFIIVAASLTDTSRGLLNHEQLAKVKQCHVFVNVSRGGIVVESALFAALKEGRIGFAALDVRSPEPPDPADDLLTGLPNVLLTQHIASVSDESSADIHAEAANQILGLLELAGRLPAS